MMALCHLHQRVPIRAHGALRRHGFAMQRAIQQPQQQRLCWIHPPFLPERTAKKRRNAGSRIHENAKNVKIKDSNLRTVTGNGPDGLSRQERSCRFLFPAKQINRLLNAFTKTGKKGKAKHVAIKSWLLPFFSGACTRHFRKT